MLNSRSHVLARFDTFFCCFYIYRTIILYDLYGEYVLCGTFAVCVDV